jgi:hypothetical protein
MLFCIFCFHLCCVLVCSKRLARFPFLVLLLYQQQQNQKINKRNPTDEELFELISIVDTNMSGTIDFAEFLQVIDYQKSNADKGFLFYFFNTHHTHISSSFRKTLSLYTHMLFTFIITTMICVYMLYIYFISLSHTKYARTQTTAPKKSSMPSLRVAAILTNRGM